MQTRLYAGFKDQSQLKILLTKVRSAMGRNQEEINFFFGVEG
jgi:hypothetical protein